MDTRSCDCPLHWYEKLPLAQRQKLFDGFWESGSFHVQNAYLGGCIKVIDVKRRYTGNAESCRSHSRVYYVSNGTISVRVCKMAFLRIHGISNGRVDRALQAQMKNKGSPHSDERGRHEPGNKANEGALCFLKKHIESFPQYTSHYSQSDNPHKNM